MLLEHTHWFGAVVLSAGLSVPALAGVDHDDHDDHDDHVHEVHSDIEVGRTTGLKLAVVELPDEPIHLDPVQGLLPAGWFTKDPGWNGIKAPEDGLLPLNAPGVSSTGIVLELISIDQGLTLLENGSFQRVDDPGEFAALGAGVHSHPYWVIESGVVGEDFAGTLSATVKLVDTNQGYGDSDPITLRFTNVPEPTSFALLGLGGLLVARRRRG